eukprot:SAG11_NODE_24478_length_372_cov_3.937729_1_plen_62_part_10
MPKEVKKPKKRSLQQKLRDASLLYGDGTTKVPYVDSPQLNSIRHAQDPGKIYLYIRRYRPKR